MVWFGRSVFVEPASYASSIPGLITTYLGVSAAHAGLPYRTVPYRTMSYRTIPYYTVPYGTADTLALTPVIYSVISDGLNWNTS